MWAPQGHRGARGDTQVLDTAASSSLPSPVPQNTRAGKKENGAVPTPGEPPVCSQAPRGSKPVSRANRPPGQQVSTPGDTAKPRQPRRPPALCPHLPLAAKVQTLPKAPHTP